LPVSEFLIVQQVYPQNSTAVTPHHPNRNKTGRRGKQERKSILCLENGQSKEGKRKSKISTRAYAASCS